MDISAVGLCKNSPNPRKDDFTTENQVHYLLTVKPSGSGSDCIFYQKVSSEVYTIVVEISIGEANGNEVQQQPDTYIITCTYDKKGTNIAESANREIINAYVKPHEIQDNMGSTSAGTFALQLIDVLEQSITGNVPIGRYVALRGTLTGGSGSGIRAVSCIAMGGSKWYAVLRGGCGDGVVFNQTQGFTTKSLVSTSPWFKAFKLDGSSNIQFTCNFTVCSSSCDGCSCATSRRKREVSNDSFVLDDRSIEVLSPIQKVTSQTCDKSYENTNMDNGLVLYGKPSPLHKQPDQHTTRVSSKTVEMTILSLLGTVLMISLLAATIALCKRNRVVISQRRPRVEQM